MSNENQDPQDIKTDQSATPTPDTQPDVPVQSTINLGREMYSPETSVSKKQIPLSLMMADNSQAYQSLIDTSRNEGMSSKKGHQWQTALQFANADALSFTDFGKSAVQTGQWEQRITAPDGTVIGTKAVGMGDVSSDGKLTGAAAVARFRNLLGTGATRRYPLWASGFWITLRAPDEIDLLNLTEAIAQEKNEIGANSGGLALSLSTVYIIKHVANLMAASVFSTNIVDDKYNVADILSYIKITDFLGLVQFFASVIYPNGYAFQIPCAAGNGCINIDEGVLDLNAMIIHNDERITKEQRAEMASFSNRRTLKQIEDYQERYHSRKAIPINIGDDSETLMNLKIPSIAEFCESGDAIITEVIDAVNRAISEDTNMQQKQQMIKNTYNLGAAREYAHVIQSFVTPARKLTNGQVTDPETIDDPVTINEILKELSIRTDVTRSILTKCIDYLEHATYTHVVLAKHTCTKCGCKAPQAEGEPETITIPFDPVSGFFRLRDRRLQRAIRD